MLEVSEKMRRFTSGSFATKCHDLFFLCLLFHFKSADEDWTT